MANNDLASINVTSGVNERREPFLTVAATNGDGTTILLGQLDPTTVRRMAMDWLASAEAAEQDAAVLRIVRKLELPDELAGAVVHELRNSRAD